MKLMRRVERLETAQPITRARIWDVVWGDASPDQLDPEMQRAFDEMVDPQQSLSCPIEDSIAAAATADPK